MQSDPLVLTFDIGTQSMRGMLMDSHGTIVHFVQNKYETPYFSDCPGWAEQTPNFYWDTLCDTAKRLLTTFTGDLSRIIGVTVTAIRDTTMCLDKHNRPLRNIILWVDKREAKKEHPFSPIVKAAFGIVDMDRTAAEQYKASACNWISENQPDIWKKTEKFVMLPAYIHYKLTGNLVDCIANQIGHIPFDSKKRTWQKKHDIKRTICDIPVQKCPPLVESGEIIGHITEAVSTLTAIPTGLPLIATGSDKGCETLGLSVIKKHQAALSFGTTATIQFATDTYFEPQQYMPAYPAIPRGMFNPEIQIYRGYWLISWFKKEFAHKECIDAKRLGCSAEELLNERLSEIPAGCDGLMLQPYWSPGIVIPDAKGAIIGFSDMHTRAHLYRAIIEGIGFALIDGMRTMEKRSGQKITEIFVAGGGSQSDEICRITASMFGLPVKRIQTHEASGLGASMVAFVSQGVFSSYDDAILHMVRQTDVFLPDEATHALYQALYRDIYGEIYDRLEPLYKKLKKLTRRESK